MLEDFPEKRHNTLKINAIGRDLSEWHSKGQEFDLLWNLQFSANVSGMKILLFDDIVTRGISFIQCADKLMDKGAVWVDGIFLGRTLR